jgi:hypothetical protein
MLNPEVREILVLYLEYYSRLWKRQLTSREFRIKHRLAREQFYRHKLLPEINELIEEIVWLDFAEETRD